MRYRYYTLSSFPSIHVVICITASDLRATRGILTLEGTPMQDEEDDEDGDDEDAPKRGQKRLKRSRFVDDIAAVDEEEDDEEEEVGAEVARRTCSHAHAPMSFVS